MLLKLKPDSPVTEIRLAAGRIALAMGDFHSQGNWYDVARDVALGIIKPIQVVGGVFGSGIRNPAAFAMARIQRYRKEGRCSR